MMKNFSTLNNNNYRYVCIKFLWKISFILIIISFSGCQKKKNKLSGCWVNRGSSNVTTRYEFNDKNNYVYTLSDPFSARHEETKGKYKLMFGTLTLEDEILNERKVKIKKLTEEELIWRNKDNDVETKFNSCD